MGKEDIVDRLNQAVKSSGKSKAAIARLLGIERSALSRVLSRGRRIKDHEIVPIAMVLDVDPNWLLTGSNSAFRHKDPITPEEFQRLSLEDELREEQEEMARRNAGYGSAASFKPSIEGAIPEIDVLAGAGEGVVGEVINLRIGENIVSGHRVVEEWKMPDTYLAAELHISPWKSLVMAVVGDSMMPTYKAGDRVLIDLNQTEMTVDGVYVISDSDSPPQIKRLQRVLFSTPHMVDIISDNPAHQTQRVELARLTIVGRVAGVVSKQ